jgi:hypothetical protein
MKKSKILFVKIIAFFMILLVTESVYASYTEKGPVEVKQPDGTELTIYETGDHRYRRYHDENDYTVIKDRKTKFICYAIRGEDGNLKSSGYPIHLHSPQSLGLEPGLRPSPERIREMIRKKTSGTRGYSLQSRPGAGVDERWQYYQEVSYQTLCSLIVNCQFSIVN